MSRWEPGARDRLERAAIELFTEQGFAETTVPQITARAGLTTRTFFRHFADKREVLFGFEEEIPAVVAKLMADAPAALSQMALIGQGLETVTAGFEGYLGYLQTRRAIIRTDESLRERELRKSSVLSEALRRGFRERGADELTATIGAEIAVTAFNVAMDRWLDEDGRRPLPELVRDTLHAIRSVTTDSA
jgi:AcrR family transcriptional regulator